MIIHCYEPEDVGVIVKKRLWEGEKLVADNHPFQILREATFEEYKEECRLCFPDQSVDGWEHSEGTFYYEVSTD